jgi:hypothetical protein
MDVGLDHQRQRRPVDPAAAFQHAREERPRPQLQDLQLDIAGLRRQHLGRDPLRWFVRCGDRSWGATPITSVSSASISAWSTNSTPVRITSTSPPARIASSRSSRAGWFGATVCLLCVSLGRDHVEHHAVAHFNGGTPPPSCTTPGDVNAAMRRLGAGGPTRFSSAWSTSGCEAAVCGLSRGFAASGPRTAPARSHRRHGAVPAAPTDRGRPSPPVGRKPAGRGRCRRPPSGPPNRPGNCPGDGWSQRLERILSVCAFIASTSSRGSPARSNTTSRLFCAMRTFRTSSDLGRSPTIQNFARTFASNDGPLSGRTSST